MRIIWQKQDKRKLVSFLGYGRKDNSRRVHKKHNMFSMLTEILLHYVTSKSIALYASLVELFFQ